MLLELTLVVLGFVASATLVFFSVREVRKLAGGVLEQERAYWLATLEAQATRANQQVSLAAQQQKAANDMLVQLKMVEHGGSAPQHAAALQALASKMDAIGLELRRSTMPASHGAGFGVPPDMRTGYLNQGQGYMPPGNGPRVPESPIIGDTGRRKTP